MQIETYELPAFWASALINSDYSGMDEADEEALEAWMTDTFVGVHSTCVDVAYETGFTRWHDANLYVKACEAATFTFHIHNVTGDSK